MRSRRDLVCRRRLQLLDRLGGNRGWLRELSEYYKGLTIQEFWVRYTLGGWTPRRSGSASPAAPRPTTGRSTPRRITSSCARCTTTGTTVTTSLRRRCRAPGGESLAEAAAQRAATIACLNAALDSVIPLRVEVGDEVNAQSIMPRR